MKTIIVSPDHIRYGVPTDCTQCPVALALLDAGYSVVSVRAGFMNVDGIVLITPAAVCDFINHFDVYEEGEQFSFELPL